MPIDRGLVTVSPGGVQLSGVEPPLTPGRPVVINLLRPLSTHPDLSVMMARLLGRLVKRVVKKGDVILENGAAGDEMFVIEDGAVDVLVPGGADDERIIDRLKAGDNFG